ncbi:LysR family transcriptional regulator, partial [Sinorhizobium meliloti]|uniref:LysR family transcriptional regulator n=1 Tax=Rhizobium meliloti TaxID=382 RepID=UPI001295AAF8|nr:LysR family transcriptional regulator [Sinorhizobium meliloti]MQV81394.1 LysR family transcriptional regulator [Sinorhizobium meliloti]
MSDRFEALQALVTVVSEGGFSAGAKRLGIAKSAVSRRIRDLEDRLGARLFDRTTRRIQLTDSGRALHERAVALLERDAFRRNRKGDSFFCANQIHHSGR